MIIVAIAIGLVSLACWIYTLVRLFQTGNTVWGICGLCPLIAFIAGWVKKDELDHGTVMSVWSGAVVLNFLLRFALQ